jgi:hypothetical protein
MKKSKSRSRSRSRSPNDRQRRGHHRRRSASSRGSDDSGDVGRRAVTSNGQSLTVNISSTKRRRSDDSPQRHKEERRSRSRSTSRRRTSRRSSSREPSPQRKPSVKDRLGPLPKNNKKADKNRDDLASRDRDASFGGKDYWKGKNSLGKAERNGKGSKR